MTRQPYAQNKKESCIAWSSHAYFATRCPPSHLSTDQSHRQTNVALQAAHLVSIGIERTSVTIDEFVERVFFGKLATSQEYHCGVQREHVFGQPMVRVDCECTDPELSPNVLIQQPIDERVRG